MKKLVIILTLVLVLFGCAKKPVDNTTVKVAATLDPHSKILEAAKPILKEEFNLDLEIIVMDDYYIFNRALDSKEVDANYFQHVPFFEDEIKNKGYKIENVAGIHIEPFGFYSKKIKNITELKEGSKIIISNSIADHGRILKMLQEANLIKLKDNVDLTKSSFNDIIENKLKLEFVEIKPELLTVALRNNEGDLVAINGNYAIAEGLDPSKDALILEKATSDNPYVNILACHKDDVNSDKIKALIKVLKGDKIKDFINKTYTNKSVIVAE
ncbi:MAG: MetQ/NlpA family ABC transporter substrate-binding protein [Erysipelotrichaceae bacterium]